MEAKIINKKITNTEMHVIYYELPKALKNLSKKNMNVEIEKQISQLKEKGEWK